MPLGFVPRTPASPASHSGLTHPSGENRGCRLHYTRGNRDQKEKSPLVMLDGRENGVLSSFIYKREEVHTSLPAQQSEISLALVICNQRTLAGLSLSGKGIFRAILVYALPGPVLWGTSAIPKVRRAVSPFSPFQASPGSPSGSRQELGSVYASAMELLPNRPGSLR